MPGAPMAPKSKTFAASYCNYGDVKCLEGVDSHHSTQFECEEILDLIQKNGSDTVQIIPMDDLVATQINAALKKCSLTHAQKRRISVGLDCQDGVCKKLSAEIPDPFFDRGTPNEVPAYNKMEKMVSDVLKTEFNNCRKTRSTSRNNSKALIRRSSSADAIPRPQSKTKSRPKPKSKSRPKSR
jgi:ribosomal 50S subunit-recycling heat shock protein